MTKKEEFIVKQTKLNFYKKLDKKIDLLMDNSLDLNDYSQEVYSKIGPLEDEVSNLAIELDLSDEEWQQFSDEKI